LTKKNRFMKSLFATACLFVLGSTAHGQERVTVRIVDQLSEEPLAQASAHLTTDTAGATTNTMGYLQIAATPGDSLVLTAPGYLPGVVVVPQVAKFQASLDPTDSLLAFGGGIKAFYKQLSETIRYPRSARSQGLQGTTYTSFTIDESGNMTNIQPLASRPSSLHKEVISTLGRLKGQWNPAYQGEVMTLPVVFRVEGRRKDLKVEPQAIPGRLLGVVVVSAYSN
jgi:TonB family protein